MDIDVSQSIHNDSNKNVKAFTFNIGKPDQKKAKIYLIGDGVLDNFYWLTEKEQDLSYELSQMNFTVTNLAVDESRVHDLLNGLIPNHIYQSSRSYPYQLDSNNKLMPLKSMKRNHNHGNSKFSSIYHHKTDNKTEDQEIPSLAILSIGGNNIKAKLMNIVGGIDFLMNSVLTDDFVKDYEKIIHELKSHCSRLILISIYRPYLGEGSKYRTFTNSTISMINRWNVFLNNLGKTHNIPIFDLERTIDCFNRQHYAVKSETHLGDHANKCLAKCLSHIYHNYEGFKIYYAPNCDFQNLQTET